MCKQVSDGADRVPDARNEGIFLHATKLYSRPDIATAQEGAAKAAKMYRRLMVSANMRGIL